MHPSSSVRGARPLTGPGLLLATAVAAVACGSSDDGSVPDPTTVSGGDGGLVGSDDAGAHADGGSTTDAGSTDAGGGDAAADADADAGPIPIVTTTYVSSIAARRDIACVITTTGGLKCWGAVKAPAAWGAGTTWKRVAVSGYDPLSVCAIRGDDTLWCWSREAPSPTQPDTAAYASIGLSPSTRCAIGTTGALYCWGVNNLGALGTGDLDPRTTPTPIGADTDWKHVAPGGGHTCALKNGGALYCWGWNAFGQVGDGGPTDQPRTSPVAIDAANTYVDVDTQNVATCAVRADGTLLCWGSGFGKLAYTPTAIDSAKTWAKVKVGMTHACALKKDGSLYCWGSNDRGQLALPVAAGNVNRSTPQRIGVENDWVDVAVGDGFTCATKTDDTVRCWGSNGSGQLAQAPAGHLLPTPIGAAGEFAQVTAGPNNLCAVRKNGTLACWGGAGAMPTAGVASQTPLTIGTATDWKTAKPGWTGACATKTNDALHCWATGASPSATGLTVTAYDVGYFHQCAVAASALYCWGDGIFGKLGNGSNAALASPTKVGADTWKGVATSFDATCGIKTDGTLHCFGFGFSSIEKQGTATAWSALDVTPQGQVFYGLQGNSLYRWNWLDVPAASGAENDWTAIAVGAAHVCGIRTGGTLWCKGDNDYGQLGDGTLVASEASFVQVGTASDWVAVTAGTFSTCGLRGAGDLYCWGSNDYGEIGDGTSWKSDPVVVP